MDGYVTGNSLLVLHHSYLLALFSVHDCVREEWHAIISQRI